MLSRFDEIKLLAQCMATDNRDAFSRLVEAYQADVKRFILHLTGGDVSLTDDLSQDTFINAWLAIRRFRGLSGFKTWLYRIAVNEFLSYRRKRFVDTEVSIEGHEESVFNTTIKPHIQIDAAIDVNTLLRSLPDNERIVSLLFYLEDQPIKKISQILSMPEGTVKSHLARARSRMEKML